MFEMLIFNLLFKLYQKKIIMWRTVHKAKVQPERRQVMCLLLIFLWFFSAYDRLGTIVDLDLQKLLLGDGLFCPTFCFQAFCKKTCQQILRALA